MGVGGRWFLKDVWRVRVNMKMSGSLIVSVYAMIIMRKLKN